MPVLAALTVADDPEGWRRAGFAVDGGVCRLGSVAVHLRPDSRRKGIRSWALAGVDGDGPIDGLPTEAADVPPPGGGAEHPNGTTSIDHLVVMTPDVDRTTGRLEERGFEARRTRESDTYGAPMKQVFFRAGEVVLELVGPQAPMGDGDARFWGIAVTVADLDSTAALLDEQLGRIEDAVQPGRRIATLRELDGVCTAIAFMSA